MIQICLIKKIINDGVWSSNAIITSRTKINMEHRHTYNTSNSLHQTSEISALSLNKSDILA